jgi:hypothetical protein
MLPMLRQEHWRIHGIYITHEQYLAKVAEQQGRCALCGKQPGAKGLAVDHDHASGIVRGLLCSKCNAGLGHFDDDPRRLKKALEYLASHGKTGSGSGDPGV